MKSLRVAVVLGIVALSQLMCHQSILVAPPGSTLEVLANPQFIAAHGDISVVTAVVYDATGNPVADGTVVQFFTNLGRIQEQGKTNDGVARVNFTSDGRSGQATVTAISGGGAPPPPPPTTQPARADLAATSALASVASSGALVSDTVVIDIGSALPRSIVLTADPPRLLESRTSQIVANVFDAFGNPVQNVPVIFKVENPLLGFMESGGNPIHTDNSGRARDVFRTRINRADPSVEAVIEAFTPNNQTPGNVRVTIN
jgi:hypothetical protein